MEVGAEKRSNLFVLSPEFRAASPHKDNSYVLSERWLSSNIGK